VAVEVGRSRDDFAAEPPAVGFNHEDQRLAQAPDFEQPRLAELVITTRGLKPLQRLR